MGYGRVGQEFRNKISQALERQSLTNRQYFKIKKKIKSTKQKSFTVSQNPKFPAHIFLRHSPQLTGNAHEYWIDGQTPTLIGYGISCFSANVNRLYSIPQLSIQVFLFTNQWTKLETLLSCSVELCSSKCDVQWESSLLYPSTTCKTHILSQRSEWHCPSGTSCMNC